MAAALTRDGRAITTNRLRGSGTEPLNIGWGLNPGALTAAAGDTALFDPAPEARVAGTSSQATINANSPNDTYQSVATITASAPRVIQEIGMHDTATAAPQTTLNGSMTSGVTTAAVVANAGFPGSGAYDIQVDNEVMTVTAGQGTNSWTVTRGAYGTTAASHSSGANVVGGKTTAGGNCYMHADIATLSLGTGDAVAWTAQVQYQ